MWSMWDAPSDRDYVEQFNPPEPEAEDPDEAVVEVEIEGEEMTDAERNERCPF